MVPAELPVLLPKDVKFDSKGNPLEKHPAWKHVKCPNCGGDALRDTDTLDTFFESSWYFLRYLDPNCEKPINKEISNIATPVDLCIGGVEHAVLHLLYARFFMLVLKDMGYINTSMPFKSLLTQGMVCHKSYQNTEEEWVNPEDITLTEDGKLVDKNGNRVFEFSSEKMSKSKRNTINPEKIIDSHGVDALRLFIISDTPPEKDFDWNTDALDGSWKFLNRMWKIFNMILDKNQENASGKDSLIKTTHVYLKKIMKSYESVSLNKSVALIREFFNCIEINLNSESSESLKFAFTAFIKAIYPITPYICHEMWDILEKADPLQNENWPGIDQKLAVINKVVIAVQVNGKLRGIFEIEKDSDNNALEQKAFAVLGHSIDTSSVKRVIVVKNKIVNIVV
jgi:leucyl-tRNA synthetase